MSIATVNSGTIAEPVEYRVRDFTTFERAVVVVLVFSVVFGNGADFVDKTGDETFELHWQIYLRLFISMCCGIAGLFWLLPFTYRDFLTWPGLLVTLYTAWMGLSVATSVEPVYSAAAWCSLVGVVLFVPSAMRILGGLGMVRIIGLACLAYVAGSWLTYWYFPDIGIWKEKITSTDVVERMGGLGHPNQLGFYSLYTLVAFAVLTMSGHVSRWMSIPIFGVALFTLVKCLSRTSMIVALIAMLITLRPWFQRRGNFIGITSVLAVLFLALFAAMTSGRLDWMMESAILGSTKSGTTDELLTVTGRTDIWAYGITKILESPVLGWGYCSARFVMTDYSFHCHNLVLNAALHGGLPAGALAAFAVVYLLYSLVFRPDPSIDGFAVVFLVGGLV